MNFDINEFRVSSEYHKLKKVALCGVAYFGIVLPGAFFGSKKLTQRLSRS